ncbi:MAG: hypothetical protein AB1Z18_13985, partial [Desulfobacterales bacterium]
FNRTSLPTCVSVQRMIREGIHRTAPDAFGGRCRQNDTKNFRIAISRGLNHATTGYTGAYAFANVILILAGTLIMWV